MGVITDRFNSAFRDYATAGVPSSGAHEPVKSEIRAIGPAVESAIAQISAAGLADITKDTKANLDADLAHAAGTVALVYADSTIENNDLYLKSGASGAGSWSNTGIIGGTIEALAQPYVDAAEDAASFATSIPAASSVGFGGDQLANRTTATGVTVIGASAGRDVTSGGNNSFFGFSAGRATTTGQRNVYAGAGAGLLALTSSDNVGLGEFALGNTASLGSQLVGVGRFALRNSTASENAAVGNAAGSNVTSGVRFAALGASAGGGHTTEDAITCVGWGAGLATGQVFGYNNQTIIGANSYATWENQVVLGDDQVAELRLFGTVWMRSYAFADVILGQNAGNRGTLGGARVIIGYEAAVRPNTATDERAIYIGYLNGNAALNNRAFVSIGSNASQYAENNVDVTVVGDQAGRWLGRAEPESFEDAVNDPAHLEAAGADLTNGLPTPEIMVGHCFFGKNAGRYNTIGQNNTGLGDSALGFTLTGGQNVAVGYVCGEGNVHGSRNTWAGQGVRVYQYSGDDNTQIGYAIGEGVGSFGTWLSGGSRNCNLGVQSVHKWRGNDVCSLGYRAFFNMTGGDGGDVGVGTRAGQSVTVGGNNVFIGDESGNNASQLADVQGSIAIGAGTFTTRDNEIVLGTGSITHVSVAGVTFTKAQIEALLALVD